MSGPRCPAETFPTPQAATTELLARRTRATLAGNPPTHPREPYTCHCGNTHIRRTTTAPERTP